MSTVQPSTRTSMFDLAEDLLAAVVAAMGTTEAGAPASSYVSLGAPAWGPMCSIACVQVVTLTEGVTSPTSPPEVTGLRHSIGRVNLVGLIAYSIRCVSVTEGDGQSFKWPADATLTAEARRAYEDGWAVWNWVNRAIQAGELFGGPCGIVHIDGGVPVTPAGGLGGWAFTLRPELDGYDPRV